MINRKILIKISLILFIFIFFSNNLSGSYVLESDITNVYETNEHPWSMFRHDLKHTGRTKYTGPPTPELSWKYKTDDGIVSSAAIHADGTIYVGAGFNKFDLKDPNLYAFNPDGSLKWKFDGTHGFFSSPAIGSNNTIYCVSNGDFLFSLEDVNSYAKLNWKKRLEYFFGLSSPTVGKDGIIHVGCPSFYYFQINPDGSIKWSYKTDWCIISSAAIDDYGTVYIGSKDHNLYAFSETEKKLKWKYSIGQFYDGHCIDSSPAIGDDGTIYFGSDPYGAMGQDPVEVTTNFWAVNPNGTLKWVFETEDGVESSPAIGLDRNIYFGSYDGYLYSVKDDGNKGVLNWKFKTNDSIDGSPIVDGDGIIYFASRDSYLYALYPDGSLKWKFKAEDGFESSPSIDANGYLYIGSFDGFFYCIGTGGSDVGVESIKTPSYLPAGASINPNAIIRNYRGNTQNFDVACEIENNGNLIYSDIQSIEIFGGFEKEVIFSPFEVENKLDVIYNMTVRVIHEYDENKYNNIKIKKLITSENFAPDKPNVFGPSTGKAGVEYIYKISTSDPNGDDVYYWISWYSDFDNASWLGPYVSGDELFINYTYENEGLYLLKVKAKDIYNEESGWSIFEVRMPIKRSDILFNNLLFKIIKKLQLFNFNLY